MLVARFVDFRWSVKISLIMGVPEEEDGVIFSVFWPLPFSRAVGAATATTAMGVQVFLHIHVHYGCG